MRVLEFIADKQLLQKDPACDFTNIAPGSSGYLTAHFKFSTREWRGCVKAASFWYNGKEYAVLLKNDACVIPSEVLVARKFEVSVSGARSSGYRITSTRTTVRQEG